MRIVDADRVKMTNLQGQILHRTGDVGEEKDGSDVFILSP